MNQIKAAIIAVHPELACLSPDALEAEIATFIYKLKLLLEVNGRVCACCD
ncbi:MAG: hypothetical protein JWM16_5552 [Verrucomicrobiales bacterium]|nr:hypothetical protein [Verrucomicrobiales bacterium]